jgi:hypothetical protein
VLLGAKYKTRGSFVQVVTCSAQDGCEFFDQTGFAEIDRVMSPDQVWRERDELQRMLSACETASGIAGTGRCERFKIDNLKWALASFQARSISKTKHKTGVVADRERGARRNNK